MPDSKSIKKMLRSVLQSSKTGVPINRVQAEYQSLCGETIPVGMLGFSNLEEYLRSIPSVVRMEYRKGELTCFAEVCEETAHIAELVAKQKNSKKCSRLNLVSCNMRPKFSTSAMPSVKHSLSLRHPSAYNASNWSTSRQRSQGGSRGVSAAGDYRQFDQSLSSVTPVDKRRPVALPAVNQLIMTDRMEKSWPNYKKFSGKVSEQVSRPVTSEVEQAFGINQAGCLVYRPLHPKPSAVSGSSGMNIPCKSQPVSTTTITPVPPSVHRTPQQPANILRSSVGPKAEVPSKNILAELNKLFRPVTLRSPAAKPGPAPSLSSRETLGLRSSWNNLTSADALLSCSILQNGSEILNQATPIHQPLLKSAFSSSGSTPVSPSNSCVAASDEVRQRLKELLLKYSYGVWAHALPKLFMDTFEMAFPEHLLNDMSLFLDICVIDYPLPHDKSKAILYLSTKADMEFTNGQESQQHRKNLYPSGVEVLGPVVPPSEQYPSLHVTDAQSTTAVTVRCGSESYSDVQEAMEDTMDSFCSQDPAQCHAMNPVVAQLVAARQEEGDELARAQVMEVMAPDKVKVDDVDSGFSVETSTPNLWELHQDVLSLPVQATNGSLAGIYDVKQTLLMPPPLELPKAGENVDVFVPVACHPGHFVVQLWQDLHKLAVLMGEMVIYYNQKASSGESSTATDVRKGDVCAAQIGKSWHRVMVEGILANRLASVYDLDRGEHELICCGLLRPLIEAFLQLPFQAVTVQLAGVTQHHWSGKASAVFRNHVEQRALVAHVASVLEESEDRCDLQEPRLTVYLVDTTVEDRDVWIHTVMANMDGDLSLSAQNGPSCRVQR